MKLKFILLLITLALVGIISAASIAKSSPDTLENYTIEDDVDIALAIAKAKMLNRAKPPAPITFAPACSNGSCQSCPNGKCYNNNNRPIRQLLFGERR